MSFKPDLTGLSEPPNADLIKWLEDTLASAKAGDLRHVLVVGIWRGRVVSTGWTVNAPVVTAFGGIRMLEHDFARAANTAGVEWGV